MGAVIDQDHAPLERWPEMAEAEMAVVYDARLGGMAVTMIGMESRPLPRHGVTPADGPAQWSAGTLFPLSSKKVARAINAASGCRPVVVLANLSGFDGSPESLRRLQLEYGAEIGRAIVNFDGPFVLCVVSRYHGGAFVVFSATLNDDMEVLAVEGSFASVIGGAPGRRRGVHPRGRRPHARRRAGRGARGRGRRAPPPEDASLAPGRAGRRRATRCAPRSSARSPPSSTPCTASSGPRTSARCTASSRPPTCARSWSPPSSAACSASTPADLRLRRVPIGGGFSQGQRLTFTLRTTSPHRLVA